MLAVAEFGVMTVAVLRAELGELDRFARMDQVVAYAAMDLQIKESGKWKGETNCLNEAVADFAASSTWRLSGAFACQLLPLDSTIIAWLIEG